MGERHRPQEITLVIIHPLPMVEFIRAVPLGCIHIMGAPILIM